MQNISVDEKAVRPELSSPAAPQGDGASGPEPLADVNQLLEQTVASARLRRGAGWGWQVAMLVGLLMAGAMLWVMVGDVVTWATHRVVLLLLLGGIGTWRWSWFLLQNTRAAIYRYIVFPRIRRQAARAVAECGPMPEVTVMAATYKERPWITRLSFSSIFQELGTLRGLTRRPKVVVATGCAEDEANVQAVYEEQCLRPGDWPAGCWPPELVMVRAENGKRNAIASALREIIRGQPREDGVVIFLDGDTMMRPGFMMTVLPIFRIKPEVAGVTSNEDGFVQGPKWFAEWITMRFGLRHRTMCSIALSGKLLCLTGRLSVFRAGVAVNPTFLGQIERDEIQHWLWGSFEMLSGDDKSTWYWLSRHGCRMLYVPDAKVTTIEVVAESPLKRASANIRRWSGNSLRHSWRAILLGPKRLGWFPWWCLVDQRISMFTVLVGPSICLTALFNCRFGIAAGFALWVLFSRLAHTAICCWHGRRISFWYVPIVPLSDWAMAIIKLWVLFHPAKQSWLNRGRKTLDTTRNSRHFHLQTGLAHYLYGLSCFTLLVVISIVAGFLPLAPEARLFLHGSFPGEISRREPPPANSPQPGPANGVIVGVPAAVRGAPHGAPRRVYKVELAKSTASLASSAAVAPGAAGPGQARPLVVGQ